MGGGSPVDNDDDDLIPSAVGGDAPLVTLYSFPPFKPNCNYCAIQWSWQRTEVGVKRGLKGVGSGQDENDFK